MAVAVILFVGFGVWYNAPIDLLSLDYNEVLEIVVFNGNTGNTHILRTKNKSGI